MRLLPRLSHLPDFADRSTAFTTLSVCMASSKVGSARFFFVERIQKICHLMDKRMFKSKG
jgi:hypothetical protein